MFPKEKNPTYFFGVEMENTTINLPQTPLMKVRNLCFRDKNCTKQRNTGLRIFCFIFLRSSEHNSEAGNTNATVDHF